ncbi:MAG: hypothetical protein QM516_02770 [Limnohabitans sp.]|nr:hypothetical protein [Limnohabitans sp.]
MSIPRAPICPRFDACDPRCESRTTLGHLDEVFRFCTSDYESCPIFAGSAGVAAVERHEFQASGCSAGIERDPHLTPRSGDTTRSSFASCDGPLAEECLAGTGVAELVRDAVQLTIRGVRILAEGGTCSEGDGERDARLQHAAASVHDLRAR